MVHDRIALDDQDIHVWCVDASTIALSAPGQVLDTAEMARANQFYSVEHTRQYQNIHGLLRLVLSYYMGCDCHTIVYDQNTYGKPGIKSPPDSGLMFNLSHSGNLAVIVVALRDVGVDIERISPVIPADEIARSFFSPAEFSVLHSLSGRERLNAFYRLWTRKEALLKATGEGLNGLSGDVDLLTESVIVRQNRAWHVRDLLLADGYAGAMAIEGNIIDVKYMDYNQYPGSAIF